MTTSAAPAFNDLLCRPTSFFKALGTLPPQPWRYIWLPALTGVLSGIGAALLSRSNVEAQLALSLTGTPQVPAFATYLVVAFSSFFLTIVTWLLLWGLGSLGAGKAGRAAEVYGVTFAPQLLWSLILLPLAFLFAPQVSVSPPNLSGLDQLHAAVATQQYLQTVAAKVAATPIMRLSSYGTYAAYLWQFALAYVAFKVLSTQPNAVRGVLYPLALLLALLLVGWLVTHSLGSVLRSAAG